MAKGQQGKGGTPGGVPPVVKPPVVATPTPAMALHPVPTPVPSVPVKPPTVMELLQQRLTIAEARLFAVEEFIAKGGPAVAGKPKAKFGGKRGATPTKDTQTGLLYESKSAVGKALAAENELDPDDHYVWYELIKKFPERFVDCNEAESAIVLQRRDERIAKEIAEANAKIAADEAAANLAASKAQK